MVDVAKMEAQLILHEGEVLHYYEDNADPSNKTWGIGYNVSARGVGQIQAIIGRKLDEAGTCTSLEARKVLHYDINRCQASVQVYFPEYVKLSEIRQRVCLDVAFNIGFKALGFKKTMAAIKAGDWSTAARELHKSALAKQTGERNERLARMLLTNEDYA